MVVGCLMQGRAISTGDVVNAPTVRVHSVLSVWDCAAAPPRSLSHALLIFCLGCCIWDSQVSRSGLNICAPGALLRSITDE